MYIRHSNIRHPLSPAERVGARITAQVFCTHFSGIWLPIKIVWLKLIDWLIAGRGARNALYSGSVIRHAEILPPIPKVADSCSALADIITITYHYGAMQNESLGGFDSEVSPSPSKMVPVNHSIVFAHVVLFYPFLSTLSCCSTRQQETDFLYLCH